MKITNFLLALASVGFLRGTETMDKPGMRIILNEAQTNLHGWETTALAYFQRSLLALRLDSYSVKSGFYQYDYLSIIQPQKVSVTESSLSIVGENSFQLKIEANVETAANYAIDIMGWFGGIDHSLKGTLIASGQVKMLLTSVLSPLANGRFGLSTPSCQQAVGAQVISFKSGDSISGYPSTITSYGKHILNQLETRLCTGIHSEIRDGMQADLNTKWPHRQSLFQNLTLLNGVTSIVNIGKTGAEFGTEGRVAFASQYLSSSTQESILGLPIPAKVPATRAVTVQLAADLLDGIIHAASAAGMLDFELNQRLMSQYAGYPNFLDLQCPKQDHCIGKILPELAKAFPGSSLFGRTVNATRPRIRIGTDTIEIDASYVAEINILTAKGTKDRGFSAALDLGFNLERLSLKEGTLFGSIRQRFASMRKQSESSDVFGKIRWRGLQELWQGASVGIIDGVLQNRLNNRGFDLSSALPDGFDWELAAVESGNIVLVTKS